MADSVCLRRGALAYQRGEEGLGTCLVETDRGLLRPKGNRQEIAILVLDCTTKWGSSLLHYAVYTRPPTRLCTTPSPLDWECVKRISSRAVK